MHYTNGCSKLSRENDPRIMSKKLAVLFAIAAGLAIGNLYWSHPLLAVIADDFGQETARGGFLVTATQIGYAAGILLIVPLGDIRPRRRLIVTMMSLSILALAACALAPSFAFLALSLLTLGVVTVSGQIILPLVSDLAAPEERGNIVGIVSSGITTGILLARFVSGIVANYGGWRMIYIIAVALNLVMVIVIARLVPAVPPKTDLPYSSLLKDVFTAFKRYPVLPRILLQTAMIFGITFNLFWTSLTFLLSGEPFHYSTFQIGLVSLVGLTGAVAGSALGKLQDKGLGIPALGFFGGLAVLSMLLCAPAGHSIIAIALLGAVFSLAVQGVNILCQLRLFSLSYEERSRLNTLLLFSNFVFCPIGSALASVLWNIGGWPLAALTGAAASLIGFLVWVFSRKTFAEMDRKSR